MIVDFDVNSVSYGDFFQDGGTSAERYFEGLPFQRGYGARPLRGNGVGSVFKHLLRMLMPIAKRAAPILKKEGLEAGARILHDVAEGASAKEAIVEGTKQAVRNLAKQAGGGRRKRKRGSRKGKRLVGRSVSKKTARKKRKVDSLGFY